MKYFFSFPSHNRPTLVLKAKKIDNLLFSFAVVKKEFVTPFRKTLSVIIDSGAFTLWKQGGKTVDIEEYKDYCLTLPKHWVFVNLDVIPETGSTSKQIQKYIDKGFENYLYLSKHLKNVLPVHHFGESIDIFKKYNEHTDYIGVSPANDTSEKVKKYYLRSMFSYSRDKIKIHGFGYSSPTGLELFPFYSVDSSSWYSIIKYNSFMFLPKKLSYAFSKVSSYSEKLALNIDYFKSIEENSTNLWESRGVVWD